MAEIGLNSIVLITFGAGFIALSFNKGRAGQLKHSIWFAALSAVVGLIKAGEDGVYARDPFEITTVVTGYLLLSVAAVAFGRKLYARSQR